jgi:hypothetical protein
MQTAYATKHATARVRQRGIPASLVELLIQYGQESHDGHGARVVRFNRHSQSLLKKELGAKVYARWESRLNVYAVISGDDGLITIGHRVRRIFRRH